MKPDHDARGVRARETDCTVCGAPACEIGPSAGAFSTCPLCDLDDGDVEHNGSDWELAHCLDLQLCEAAARLWGDLVNELADEPYGLSCDEIARRLRRRRTDVLAALRVDSAFVHVSGGRGSRWRLVQGARDGITGDARGQVDDRVDSIVGDGRTPAA